MPRYVYASPILPGKSETVRKVYEEQRKRLLDEEFQRETQQFWNFIGLSGWNCWMQTLEGKHYFIHALESDSLSRVFDSLVHLVRSRHPRALWLRQFYLEVLGKDYGLASSEPDIKQVLDVEFEGPENRVPRAFVYPLLSDRVEAHQEYCRACGSDQFEMLKESCLGFGVYHMTKYIQVRGNDTFVVIYQELNPDTAYRQAECADTMKENKSYSLVSQQLEMDTGMKGPLIPEIEYLFSVPETLSNRVPDLQIGR